MLLSMTGYGRSEVAGQGLTVTVDIQALNSRYLDLNIRLPRVLQKFEPEARQLTREALTRGKIAIMVSYQDDSRSGSAPLLNEALLEQYQQLFKQMSAALSLNEEARLSDYLSVHDLITSAESDPSSDLQGLLFEALKDALDKVTRMRREEGDNLAADMGSRLKQVAEEITKLEAKAGEIRASEFQRYHDRIQELIDGVQLDENRVLQEVAALAEKRDIAEECTRLRSHLQLFNELMDSDFSNGKKLGFLLQEMGREINTIGSKSNQVSINHAVVGIKAELEKVREQVQNIL